MAAADDKARSVLAAAVRRLTRAEGNLLRLLLITCGILVLMGLLNPRTFFTARNFTSMSFQFPELGILALAVMLSLVTGGIDLSIIAVANLAGILAALILTRTLPAEPAAWQIGLATAAAILTAAATGAACGAMNGLLIGYVGITPILATLGTMQLFTGFSFVITKGPAISGFPGAFLAIGNDSVLFVPVPLIVFAVLAVSTSVVLSRTGFGIRLYLIGTNETAARFSGIDVRRMLFRTYVVTALLGAAAGVIMIARTNSAKADFGESYLLVAVLVAILGGVNPAGGGGAVSGVVLALLSLQFLSSGFNMLRFSHFIQEFTWGALLLTVMVINYRCRVRSERDQG